MKEKSPFHLKIDRTVLQLLGRDLYGDTPSVIRELIANSYDAYAKNVWITIITTYPYSIRVDDDGVGMSLEDINNHYLNIGNDRRRDNKLQSELKTFAGETYGKREDMGRKGIGKLAVFALSNIVKLVSYQGGHPVCCLMDFNKLCYQDSEPETFNLNDVSIDKSHLSNQGTGTITILTDVAKDLSSSYKYVAAAVARSFVLNDESIHIFIRKNNDDFDEIKRSTLNYFDGLDVILTIGSQFKTKANVVKKNFKKFSSTKVLSYEEIATESQSGNESKKLDKLPKSLDVFLRDKSGTKPMDFSFYGWIGTLRNTETFNSIIQSGLFGYTESETKDKNVIVVDDNRITLYSRGKVGEYNILSKVKSRGIGDSYLVGEIFVDCFEDNRFIDMATSQRRGYQEDDIRYVTLLHDLKLCVNRVVSARLSLNASRDKQQKEKEIKNEQEASKRYFQSKQVESKKIFDKVLSNDQKKKIQNDYFQYYRALPKDKETKILISHKSDCKLFGDFLVSVFEHVDSSLSKRIIFTSDPKLSTPRGQDIFEYLKEAFRDELFVIFLFSKSFYDSDKCIAEAGAAWATNKLYASIVLDINFEDISKPINSSVAGCSLPINNADDFSNFCSEIKYVLDSISFASTVEQIKKATHAALNDLIKENRKLAVPRYCPVRNFQIVPICPTCKSAMHLCPSSDNLIFKCDNPSCNSTLATKVATKQ